MNKSIIPATSMTPSTRFRRPARVNIGNTKMDTPAIEFTSHSAEPIKNKDDICKISQYLIAQCRYQDNCMFIMGINFGLRCSDLTTLRYGDVIGEDFMYRDPIRIKERKTSKTRLLYVNDAVAEAFEMYCGDRTINFNDYLFYGYKGKPLSRRAVDYKLKKLINEALGLDVHASTHLLRKTFAYHTIMGASDRTRAIEYLQKAFGHSDAKTTLDYAGITADEIRNTTMSLNLGASKYIDVDSRMLYEYQYNGRTCGVLELESEPINR